MQEKEREKEKKIEKLSLGSTHAEINGMILRVRKGMAQSRKGRAERTDIDSG